VDVVATPAAGRAMASVNRKDDSIDVIYADNRGFEYRARFNDRYCDFTVYRAGAAIPQEEMAYWDAIISTLGPAES
jgi:hypothetical protein